MEWSGVNFELSKGEAGDVEGELGELLSHFELDVGVYGDLAPSWWRRGISGWRADTSP